MQCIVFNLLNFIRRKVVRTFEGTEREIYKLKVPDEHIMMPKKQNA